MLEKINLDKYIANESLYFCKYGKGGVLICLNNLEAYKIAEDFNMRDDFNSRMGNHMKLVDFIDISETTIAIGLKMADTSMIRYIPRHEITIEVYEEKAQ